MTGALQAGPYNEEGALARSFKTLKAKETALAASPRSFGGGILRQNGGGGRQGVTFGRIVARTWQALGEEC